MKSFFVFFTKICARKPFLPPNNIADRKSFAYNYGKNMLSGLEILSGLMNHDFVSLVMPQND